MTSRTETPQAEHRPRIGLWITAAGLLAVGVLAIVFFTNRGAGSSSTGTGSGKFRFAVGTPGPGAQAPEIRLTANDGSMFDLAAKRGGNVLLYFQEGVGCQPCWDQMTDIEKHRGDFQTLGINEVVSITSSPADQVKEKASQEHIKIPVLSDPDLVVSRRYQANNFGMMGDQMDGHSFVLVGPDGTIRWRADYGGEPDYTMYVPSASLLADIRAGLAGSKGGA